MVAYAQPIEGQRVEQADLAAKVLQRLPKRTRQTVRAQRIEKHPDFYPLLLSPAQRLAEFLAQNPRRINVGFQADRLLRPVDRREHCAEEFLPGTQPSALCASSSS
jgi:hypothetical protein